MTKTRKKLAIEDIHIKKFKSLDGKPMVNVILKVLKIQMSSDYAHAGCALKFSLPSSTVSHA